ncbi:hypothetical protein [Caulobacter soli]|uniref:hypothetical protein n=1 Tax=Caulobacter soli TaxID=2708539 RepID=UPI0013ED67F8|nr:hypothetical protein [Caulobacter soli]
MIRIARTAAPAALTRLGANWAKAHEEAFLQAPQAYLDGDQSLPVKVHVYGHDDVRIALRDMQHSKCCYCEVHMDEYMARHVEHWRPKGGVCQDRDGPELKPGYYWLAYDWDNLLLACVVCNSLNKGTQFPLRDPTRRARSHLDVLADEAPLLLRPDHDDPDDHIEWRDDQPRGRTDEGWATIEVVGLIRDDDPRRTKAFKAIELAYERLLKMSNHAAFQVEAQAYLEQLRLAVDPRSEFSAMARSYLAPLPFPQSFQL